MAQVDQYTFATATTELKNRLGARTDLGTRPADWLNAAMILLGQSDLEIPELETTTTFSTVASTAEYVIPTDLITDDNLVGILCVRNDTKNWLLSRMAWKEYREISTQSDDSPTRWAQRGSTIALDPKPDAVETIRVDYRRQPIPDLLGVGESGSFNNQWHETVINIAEWIGWKALDEKGKAQAALAMLPIAVARAIQQPLGQAEWSARASSDHRIYPDLEFQGGF